MKCTQIFKKQLINSDLDTVWNFMSSPNNLSKITPSKMNFKITSTNNTKMYQGMIITYKVSPLLGIPLNWMTEITHVKEKQFFVDEQRMGPYKIWHHEHLFIEKNNGVLMVDIISYKLPFGILGRLVNYLFIKNQLSTIFNYRFNKMNDFFNHAGAQVD